MVSPHPNNVVFICWDLIVRLSSAVLSCVGLTISTRRTVGIFSREAAHSYHFFLEVLRSQDLLLRDVRTFTITNSVWQRFTEEASRCDFAILYHSKSRGRLNITDVTDSIYDEELQHLSRALGKENVVVIVDDLDSAAQGDKQNILQNQPLIREKATDLILFHKDKKTFDDETRQKTMEMMKLIESTTPPITICRGSRDDGIAFLVLPFIRLVNKVLSRVFKIISGVQTRIIHCDHLMKKQK